MDRKILLNAIGRYYWLIFASLVVFGTVGGYVAYSTYTATETVTEQRVASTATTFSDFNHSTTVQEDVGVFSQGVELENKKLYFTELSPRLEGNYIIRHGGRDPEPAGARVRLRLVLRSVGDGGTVYWQESEPLASGNESSLEPGEPLSVPFSVNVTQSLDRIEEVRENLGASPGSAEILVRAESAIEGEVGSERYVDTRSESMFISPGRGTYSASSETEGRKTHEATETVVRQESPPNTGIYVGSLVFLSSIFGFVLLEKKREEDFFSVPDDEMEEARYKREKEKFNEWISEGTISGSSERQEIRLRSLTDLVDAAIDSNSRVIETQKDQKYVVLTEDVKYVFSRERDTDRDTQSE
jgi:hypothetical protein